MIPWWRIVGVSLALCFLALFPLRLDAREEEPYLSVRTGLRCSQCHVNRTGGGARNAFGSLYAQTRLPIQKSGFRSRRLNRYLSIGANFRVLASGTPSETTPRTAIEIREENLQVEARLIPDVLAVYVDQSVGPGSASTREAFALLEKLPLDGYLKAGKFLLPYGLRLVDDAEFIRERTGFNHNTPDQGMEAGIEPAPLSMFIALTNGTQGADENNNDKQITATAALIFPAFRIGASASRNDGPGSRRDVVGGFGGFSVGRFTFLGEADYVFDSFDTGPDVDQIVAYVEGNFLPVRGLNVKATYGFLDPNRDVGENARIRLRFGVEAFPIPFLQVSTFYTLLEDIPQATTDLDRISLEVHAYF
jgi:hypothetical protein